METSYTYNAANLLTNKTNRNSSGSLVAEYAYTYYLDGNIRSENDKTYTYDLQGRLKADNMGSYEYDRFGNRSRRWHGPDSTEYTYDENNRLIKESKTLYEGFDRHETYYDYDSRGNMVSKRVDKYEGYIQPETEETRVGLVGENPDSTVELYTYDGFNRLSEVSTKSGRVRYQYNAEGIRTSKAVGGQKTEFLLDGVNVIGEVSNGSGVTTYLRGVAGLISQKKPDNTKLYYVTNGHGDVTALVNPSGSITKTYTYDAFGVEQYPDPNDTNPFRYCGEYYDKETSSIYLRARYYNPGVGRFTQQDPAMADGMNWYVYCSGNPVNLYDPSGYMESGDRYITSYNTVKKLILATLAYVVSEKYNLDSSKGYNVNAGFAQSLRNNAQYDYNNTYSYSYTVVAMGYAVADEYVKQGKLEYGSSEYSEFVTMQLLNAVQYVDNTGSAYSGSLSDAVSAFAGMDIPEIGIEPTANQEMMLKFSQLEGAILEAQSVSTNVYVSVDCTRQSEGIISLWVSGYNGDELAYSANVFEMELTIGGG